MAVNIDADLREFAQRICLAPNETRHRSASECAANARLIAAAPELLEACRASLGVLAGEDMNKSALIDALTKLRAAIAKAQP